MNNYEYYANNRRNYSIEANMLMENIRNGYKPNKVESFMILSNNQKRINDYLDLNEIRNRIVSNNSITFKDLNKFFNVCSIDISKQDDIINSLNKKGLLVREYLDTKDLEKGRQYVKTSN